MSIWFGVVATAMLLLAMGIVLRKPARGRIEAARAAELNAVVLGDRLRELEREHARGLIDARELAGAREELQRRALAEAGAEAETAVMRAGGVRPRVTLVATALALPVAAVALYLVFGSPYLLDDAGAPGAAVDAAAAEAAQAQASAGSGGSRRGPTASAALVQLEAHVAQQPNDARAWVLLARTRMDAGQYAPAAVAYQRALDAQPRVARDPQVWCEYADAVGMSQGGTLAGRPRELIDRALALDAAAPCALEMAGSAAVEVRDWRTAREHWRRLLALLPAGSAQHAQLSGALARIERQAQFALPARPSS